MINDEQFKKYIGEISDKYEEIKDYIFANIDISQDGELLNKLAEFRDITCTALRDSHINKNFGSN